MDKTHNVEYALLTDHPLLTNLPTFHDNINISLYHQDQYMKNQLMQILPVKLAAEILTMVQSKMDFSYLYSSKGFQSLLIIKIISWIVDWVKFVLHT